MGWGIVNGLSRKAVAATNNLDGGRRLQGCNEEGQPGEITFQSGIPSRCKVQQPDAMEDGRCRCSCPLTILAAHWLPTG